MTSKGALSLLVLAVVGGVLLSGGGGTLEGAPPALGNVLLEPVHIPGPVGAWTLRSGPGARVRACPPTCPTGTNSTEPAVVVANLQATQSSGSGRRPGEVVDLNVSNLGGPSSVAEGVTVLFYLLSGTHDLGALGGSPAGVVWYGYVGGVRNSSSSFGGGSVAGIGVNETYQASLSFQPAFNLTGTYQLCANATATNEAPQAYKTGANVECISASFPHMFGFGGPFLLIIVIPVVIVVVVLVVVLRRRSRREREPPRQVAPEKPFTPPANDDLSQLLARAHDQSAEPTTRA